MDNKKGRGLAKLANGLRALGQGAVGNDSNYNECKNEKLLYVFDDPKLSIN